MTTNKETMETIRIGHMIGPPASKFRTKKFRLAVAPMERGWLRVSTFALPASERLKSAGEVAAAGEMSAVTGAVPGAGGTAGRPWCPGRQLLERPGQSSWPEPSLFREQLEQPATRRYQRVKVRRDWSPERRPDLERRWRARG